MQLHDLALLSIAVFPTNILPQRLKILSIDICNINELDWSKDG